MTEVVLDVIGNTLPGDMLGNVVLSSKLDLPWFDFNDDPKEDSICIVGGAPSLTDMFPYLQARYKNGSKVWAVNGSFDWLTERNIIPHAHVMLDARPENIRFVNNPDKDFMKLNAIVMEDMIRALEKQPINGRGRVNRAALVNEYNNAPSAGRKNQT